MYRGKSSGPSPWSCEGLIGGAVYRRQEYQHRAGDDDRELVYVQSVADGREELDGRTVVVCDSVGDGLPEGQCDRLVRS